MDIPIIIAYILIIALMILVIYLYVYVFKNIKDVNNAILEIKSKIGSMIRDVNTINKNEFRVDMEQQQSINNLLSRLS